MDHALTGVPRQTQRRSASLSHWLAPQLPILLVARDGGVENNFPGALGARTNAPALEDRAVFQGQHCNVQSGGPPGKV
jgi:hypothetical protein